MEVRTVTQVNEIILKRHGASVVMYRGSGYWYMCKCTKPAHFFKSFKDWSRHFAISLDVPYRIRCCHCLDFFPSIRSVAQHSIRCVVRSNSQLVNMVTPPDAVLQTCVDRQVECPHCDLRARNKRGLRRHMHVRHPDLLYNKYLNKRLTDKRWSRCEAKVLTVAMYKLLSGRGLPLDNTHVLANMRECYLLIKSKLAKSYRHVKLRCESGVLESMLETRSRRAVRMANVDAIDSAMTEVVEGPVMPSCDCLNYIRQYIVAQVASHQSLPDAGKRLRQVIRRETNSPSTSNGTLLLREIYKRYGEKTAGHGCDQGSARPEQSRGSRNRTDMTDENQLYKRLKAKQYMSHLCEPGLMDLEPSTETIRWFGEQFERPSIDDYEPFKVIDGKAASACALHGMISQAECELHAKSFKKGSASGNDGFTTDNLKSTPISLLTILMNLFMLAGDVPQNLKVNRTTLLAKKPNPGPTEWRPITVSSVLYRLFSKIITRRLTAEIYLSPHQRAFRPGIDGCMENSANIAELIRRANSGEGELYCCSLDLAKAFDSVSFTSIVRMLKRQRIDDISLKLLTNMLYNNVTIVSKQQESRITRGVRQGDPISPLLFNGVIDELFEYLKNDRYGAAYKKRNGTVGKIVAVAFADDITLLCNSQRHLDKLLKISISFFRRRGMKINIKKSSCLAIRRLPHSDICTPLPVKIEIEDHESGSMECLPCIGPSADLRILGTYITPMGKPTYQKERLTDLLKRVKDSSLEAYNKVEIIRNHVVFKFRFQIVYGKVCQTEANKADKLIREAVRSILDLPTNTAIAFFHLPRSKGGLGIESLEFSSTFLRVKMELELLKSEREATRELVRATFLRNDYIRNSKAIGYMGRHDAGLWLSDTTSSATLFARLSDIDAEQWYSECRERQVATHQQVMCSLVQGAAYEYLVGAPLDYMSNPERYGLELQKFPLMYRMRLGLDRVLSNLKGSLVPGQSLNCRLCHTRKETPRHVYQKCRLLTPFKVARHNAIVGLLYRFLDSKLNSDHGCILKEQEFVLTNTTSQTEVRLKPDIVIVCRNRGRMGDGVTRVSAIDVTCSYESLNGSSLDKAYERKRTKYQILKAYLNSDTNLKMLEESAGGICRLTMGHGEMNANIKFKVHPFVVGVKGGWKGENKNLFKYLEIVLPDEILVNCIMKTVGERSINIFKKFMGKVRAVNEQ